jgi:hypothetical protein
MISLATMLTLLKAVRGERRPICGDVGRNSAWPDVLVEMEDVVGVVLPLQRRQPV